MVMGRVDILTHLIDSSFSSFSSIKVVVLLVSMHMEQETLFLKRLACMVA